jgi:hypothetical protein
LGPLEPDPHKTTYFKKPTIFLEPRMSAMQPFQFYVCNKKVVTVNIFNKTNNEIDVTIPLIKLSNVNELTIAIFGWQVTKMM